MQSMPDVCNERERNIMLIKFDKSIFLMKSEFSLWATNTFVSKLIS